MNLDDVLFQQKLGQVKKQPSEKDRMRLLKNVADNFRLSVDQAFDFCSECHDAGSRMDVATMLYESEDALEDKQAFVDKCLASLFKYEEDKKEFCDKLHIEFKTSKRDDDASSGVKVNRFDKHSVSGYSG